MGARGRTLCTVASIEERGPEAWRVRWRYGGTRTGRQQSTTWPTLPLAQRAQAIAEAHRHAVTDDEVYAAILGPAEPESTALLVREWADTWLKSRTRISPGQRATYRGQLDREILPHRGDDGVALGDRRLAEGAIEGSHIAALLNYLRSKFKDSTVTRYYACVHAMFAYAVVEKKIPDNPARRTDFVRDIAAYDDSSDEGDDHVYLTRDEYRILLAAFDGRDRPLVEFIAATGCRFSEATATAVAAVRGRTVRIYRSWQHVNGQWHMGNTKGRQNRTVPVGAASAAKLAELVKGRRGNEFLFKTAEGNPIRYSNFYNRVWVPAVIRAARCPDHPPAPRGRQVEPGKLKGPECGDNGGRNNSDGRCRRRVRRGWDRCHDHAGPLEDAVSDCGCDTRLKRRPTPHDLRHSHVAWLIAQGRPMASISQRLGHHSATITERVYAGILPEVSQADGDAVDDFLTGEGRKAGTRGRGRGRVGSAGDGRRASPV